jgi:hypothetical protein
MPPTRRKKSSSSSVAVAKNVTVPQRRSKRLQKNAQLPDSKDPKNKDKKSELKLKKGHRGPPDINEQGPSTSTSATTGKKTRRNNKNIKLIDDNQQNKVIASSSKSTDAQKQSGSEGMQVDMVQVAERYLEQAEEYIEKAERFEKEAHVTMNEADTFSKKGEDLVEKALLEEGPLAIKLYESARNTYNAARMCLEESVRCNDAATRNYKTARDYYECYGRCCPGPTHPI